MERIKNLKKGQSLPLNTIVIAILVIIVLLVIIVFFTSKVGDTSKQLDKQGNIAACNVGSNPTLSTLGYTYAGYKDSCDKTKGEEIISIVPKKNGQVCCGTK